MYVETLVSREVGRNQWGIIAPRIDVEGVNCLKNAQVIVPPYFVLSMHNPQWEVGVFMFCNVEELFEVNSEFVAQVTPVLAQLNVGFFRLRSIGLRAALHNRGSEYEDGVKQLLDTIIITDPFRVGGLRERSIEEMDVPQRRIVPRRFTNAYMFTPGEFNVS